MFLATALAKAGTITNVVFSSNGGGYVNDTVVDGSTAPLGFTATADLAQPFLNNPDSTIALGYGTYYAITFYGFGQHSGDGTIEVDWNGIPFTQAVTFPPDSPGGVTFASFALPGGDSVQISTTGLLADRISIAADGAGLVGNGNPDVFSLFQFTQGTGTETPEPTTLLLLVCGLGVMADGRRRAARRKM